jgi:long-subunit acyl-CoA synthetase (AMP-forming)
MFHFSRFFYRLTHINIGKILFRGVRNQLGLADLRFFICGGGPIAKEILIGLNTLEIYVVQGYGLTEIRKRRKRKKKKKNKKQKKEKKKTK